ncbi:SRPBCC family protein [Novosphingobium terrae]|uniref:SRPBCC family protein n=1 Tax=Novosphingobium terrae TaxID=2726189 RepID=UPI00197EF30E|nr:SRPBCC family protein [Novosphingobium terrae]
MNTDQVEKQVILRASRERVWQAISDSAQFGTWFGVAFDGPFVAGQEIVGRITPTTVDPAVAALQEPHRGTAFKVFVERIEPMHSFAFRWHPFAIDPAHDYEAEPMTLVTFTLSDAEGGVLLSITETGFDQLPLARRAMAWQANDGGWQHQTRLIERYLALEAGQA